MIDVDELARRLCAEGHLAPRRDGPHATCASHILLARATYPLITPAEQPQGARTLNALCTALVEANPDARVVAVEAPRPEPVAVGQIGLADLVGDDSDVRAPTDV